jgi:hypothetical protein
MTRNEALLFVERVRALGLRDSVLCHELAQQLSPAEQSALRSFLREAGAAYNVDYALNPEVRTKGASV